MAVLPSEDTRGGKEEEAKLELIFFAKCQKRREKVEPEILLHFKLRMEFLVLRRDRFCSVPERSISYMSFWSLKTTVIQEDSITASDSMRTSRVKPRFVRFSRRE